MGAEIGATTSLFPYDDDMAALPEGHRPRGDRRRRRRRAPSTCAPTPRSLADPERFFDQVIEIDLVDARAAHQRPAHPRPRPPGLRRSAPRPRRRASRSRSASALVGSCTNSSYEDITRAASIARQAAANGPAGARRQLLDHAGLRAGAGHDRARRPARRPRGASARRCSPTRAARASASGSAPTSTPGDGQHDRQLATTATSRSATTATANTLALRRPRPRRSSRLALAGTARLRPAHRHAHQRRRRAVRLDAPVGEELPAKGFDPGESGFIAAARRRARRRRRGRPRLRPAPAARAVPAVGRQRLHRPAGAAEGQGQVHHRPHLAGRPVAEVPRPPREHLGQPVHRRDQRVHRRGRRRARTSSTATTKPFPDIAKHYNEAGHVVGRGRRRELRRGLVARARRDGAPVPRRQGRSSSAASPASTRPT